MKTVHEIRLAGPWEYTADNNAPTRCKLPISLAEIIAATDTPVQTAVIARRFHQPTGLTAASALELVVSDSRAVAELQVNNVSVAATQPEPPPTPTDTAAHTATFRLTTPLQSFNTLQITLNPNSQPTENSIHSVLLRILEPQ